MGSQGRLRHQRTRGYSALVTSAIIDPWTLATQPPILPFVEPGFFSPEDTVEAIQWDESLSVGIELIDDQHKRWIQRLNNIAAAIQRHEGPRKIAETLDFLTNYTEFHFATEEQHMAANNFPGLDEHRLKHEELKGTLENLDRDFDEEGATHALAQAVNTFLGNWLIEHIRETDQQFGSFLREKGITLAGES